MTKKFDLTKGVILATEAAGSQANLAKALGVSRQTISAWRKVPILRVLSIEKAYGISRHQLRPDIYGAKA